MYNHTMETCYNKEEMVINVVEVTIQNNKNAKLCDFLVTCVV